MIYLFYALQVALDRYYWTRGRDMHVWPIWLRSAYLSTCMDGICNTTCLNVECQRYELVWLELMPSYSDIRLTSLQQGSQCNSRYHFLFFRKFDLVNSNDLLMMSLSEKLRVSFPRPRCFMETRRQKWGQNSWVSGGPSSVYIGSSWICWSGNLRTHRRLTAFRSNS